MRGADAAAWRRFLEERGVAGDLAARWSSYARPGIALMPSAVRAEDDTAPGTSKLGGWPDLPADRPWPVRPAYTGMLARWVWAEANEAVPLAFLAQINLADVARAGCDLPLPEAGLLLFFYDAETQPWGFDPLDAPGTQVLYVAPGTATHRRPHPEGAPCPVRIVDCVPREWLPDPFWVHDRITEEQPGYTWDMFYEELQKLDREDDARIMCRGHAFGGWPDPVQGAMELECEMTTKGLFAGTPQAYAAPEVAALRAAGGEAQWRLLLQLESDEPGLDWLWGDSGRLYFWCREEDIAARRFDRGWTILQCT